MDRVDVFELLRQLGTGTVELRWNPGTKTIVLIVFSEKGGVGKTSLVNALAAVMGAAGHKVLVIDLDPRATATHELGVHDPAYTVNDLLYIDAKDPNPVSPRGLAAEAILPTSDAWPDTVHLIAAERALGNRESDNTPGMEIRLKLALEGGVADGYDLVLVDVPPRPGGKIAAAAIQVATHAILPSTLDEDGFIGAADAVVSIRRSRLNAGQPPLPIIGVLRNIVDRRFSGLAQMYDVKLSQEWPAASTARCGHCDETTCPHVPRLIEGVAIPKYVVRQEARSAEVPFTSAGTPEADLLRRACIGVLNRVSEVA
jgi:chromosome partitioning protein